MTGACETTGAREQILRGLRAAIDGGTAGPRPATAAQTVDARLAGHARNLVPRRAQLPRPALEDLFVAKAVEVAASVDRVGIAEVPLAVHRYLAERNLPAVARLSPDPALDLYPWQGAGMLQLQRGRTDGSDTVSVTPAFAGIAETGTLMLWSAPTRPTSLNFLPETHIAVLLAQDIVPAMEDAWDQLRAALLPGQAFPRTVNLITGPSRTADIEQELILGAHGPRRLHILLVGDRE